MSLVGRLFWLLSSILWLFGLLWFVISAFVREWLFSRAYWRLLWGLPSLAAVVVFATAIVQAAFPSYERVLRDRYSAQAQNALSSESQKDLELYVCRLVELGGHVDPWLEFAQARVAERRGNIERTRRFMMGIATADRPGYGPAHFWLAKDLMGRTKLSDPDTFRVVHHHLIHSLQHEPNNPEILSLLGQLHHAAGHFGPATQHLEQVIDEYPHLSLPLAQAYFRQRTPEKRAKGMIAAQAASSHFASAIQEGTGGDTRLLWAESETLLGNYGKVTEILKQGLATDPENKRLRTALGQAYLIWSESLRQSGASLGDQLSKLRQALDQVPGHAGALTRLAEIAMSDDPAAKKARQWLVDALDKGDLPPSVRLLLGTKAAEQGKYDLAKSHLLGAYEQGLVTPELLNNLGWILVHVDPPEYDKALEVLDRAIGLSPHDPEIRETRGQIYVKLARYEDAIEDLEVALPKMNGRIAIHEALATAYEKLGEPAMADAHREIIRQLKELKERTP